MLKLKKKLKFIILVLKSFFYHDNKFGSENFDFISVKNLYQKAKSKKDLLKNSNKWSNLFLDSYVKFDKKLLLEISPNKKKAFFNAETNGIRIEKLFKKKIFFSGSIIANLKNIKIIDNSLLILIKKNLSLSEGYGDQRWAEYTINRWPKYHNYEDTLVRGANLKYSIKKVKIYKNNEKKIVIKGPAIYLSLRKDNHFYHWVFENLTRLKCLESYPALKNYPIIIRDPLSRFQKETLKIMKVNNKIIYTKGKDVQIANLVFPSIPAPPTLNKDCLLWLRNKFLNNLKKTKTQKKLRLFISRKDTDHRKIINEDQLYPILKKKGFTILELSKLKLRDQINYFRCAEVVVMSHGAAGTHMLFAPKNCTLIELQSPSQVSTAIFKITQILQQKYSFLLGYNSNKNNDYFIDYKEITNLLNKILK